MENDVQRSPCGEVEEPHRVTLQRRQPRLGHEEQREDHREHREEDNREDDIQNRHPGHRLLGDRIVGVARLYVRARLREGIDRRRAGPARHAVSCLHECVDGRVLSHRVRIVAARSSEGSVRDRQIVFELVGRERVAQLRIEFLAPKRRVCLYHRRPLGVEHIVGLPAGDDRAVHRAVALAL